MFPSFALVFSAATTFVLGAKVAKASRAYPHGCLYRHPLYYTWDERDDISWALIDGGDALENGALVDFRRLPRKSSLRRPYERYRLTRHLGMGKFSDVFEAVDVRWESKRTGHESRRLVEGGGGTKERDEQETEATDYEEAEETSPNPESLVVLKCLKPISERRIRRELLALTHCATLPNLARLVGIVLPDSMDSESEGENSDGEKSQTAPQQHKEAEATAHSKKKRRRHHLQRKNIGSITDASSARDRSKKSTAATTATQASLNDKPDEVTVAATNTTQQLPALVLHHAGKNSQWLCHEKQRPQPTQNNRKNNNQHLSEYEMKYYLCHLLVALDGLHAVGIMHRDVKPRNTLINRYLGDRNNPLNMQQQPQNSQSRSPPVSGPPPLVLVDLGLADFYLPGKEYNVRVASRHYKSPELLIGFAHYDYAIDMWSAGCILAGLLFRREPFFRGKDNEDQLGKIVKVLGTRDFLPYCRKCNVRLSSKARAAIGKYCSEAASSASASRSGDASTSSPPVPSLLDNDMGRRTPWMSFLPPTSSTNQCPIPSPAALDLLDKLLVYDHEQRWTAREALGHAFFDDVRERVLREVQERLAWEEERNLSCQQGDKYHHVY